MILGFRKIDKIDINIFFIIIINYKNMNLQLEEYRKKQKQQFDETSKKQKNTRVKRNKNNIKIVMNSNSIQIKSQQQSYNSYDSDDSNDSDDSDDSNDSDDSDDSNDSDDSDEKIITVNSKKIIKVPKIRKKTIPSTIKRLVWNKYIGESYGKDKCYCCKLTDITQLSFHCGHVISEKNGGSINVDNLRPICQNCNSSMGSTNMDVFINKYNIHK